MSIGKISGTALLALFELRPKLLEFDVSNCELDDGVLVMISYSFPELQLLDIPHCRVSPSSEAILEMLKGLKKLEEFVFIEVDAVREDWFLVEAVMVTPVGRKLRRIV